MLSQPEWLQCFNPCSGGSIALGNQYRQWGWLWPCCFNPCSGGSIALGGKAWPMIPPQWMRLVSILVLVEVLPWDEAYDRKNRALPLFQSLFWWKYCPGMPQILLKLIMIICFNPCSGGSIALGDLTACTPYTLPGVSILVLVEVLPWEDSFSLKLIA